MARRGNGEGSVRQRPDGRWESRVRLPGGERVSAYGATRAEATEAAAKLLRDVRLGVSVMDGRQTFAEYLDRWLEIHRQAVAESTYLNYARFINSHVTPVIGAVRMNDLAPYHIERVFARMRAEGLRTYKGVYTVLHASLRMAMRQGIIVRNVVDLVTIPADVASKGYHAFSPEEARRYLAAALDSLSSLRIGPMLAVMILTGMRMGEALALSWRDVDLTPTQARHQGASWSRGEPSLRVMRSMRWIYGDPIFKEPKTNRSRRLILLMPLAVEALHNWRRTQREERLRAGAAWVTSFAALNPNRAGERISFDDLVFTDEIGRPLHEHHVHRNHRKLCRVAGLPVNRPHDLRHSFATLMLSAGVNPKVVAEMLGHSSVTLTLDRYSHVLPDMQRNAISALARLLEDPAPERSARDGGDKDQ